MQNFYIDLAQWKKSLKFMLLIPATPNFRMKMIDFKNIYNCEQACLMEDKRLLTLADFVCLDWVKTTSLQTFSKPFEIHVKKNILRLYF